MTIVYDFQFSENNLLFSSNNDYEQIDDFMLHVHLLFVHLNANF